MQSASDALSRVIEAAAQSFEQGREVRAEDLALSTIPGLVTDDLYDHMADYDKRLRGLGVTDLSTYRARGWAQVNLGTAACESPIERTMLPYLVFADYHGFQSPHANVMTCKEATRPAGDLLIIPQYPFIRYRFDFAVIGSLDISNQIMVAVECDGEAFHASPIQAERDRNRDALSRSFGVEVVRARGTDTHNNPRAVAQRVSDILSSWRDRNA